ncbi:hypothetical protein CF335_g9528 [Tilletia laevis]|nr:hypothetical protein CF335_g9528 [Tilletia laevis]
MALRVSAPRRVLIPSGTKDPGTFLCNEGSQDDLHAGPPGTILGSGPPSTLPDAALSTPFRLGYFKTLSVKPSEEALQPGPAGDPPPRALPAAGTFKHQHWLYARLSLIALSARVTASSAARVDLTFSLLCPATSAFPFSLLRSRRPSRGPSFHHRRIQAATMPFMFGCAQALDCNSSHHLRDFDRYAHHQHSKDAF